MQFAFLKEETNRGKMQWEQNPLRLNGILSSSSPFHCNRTLVLTNLMNNLNQEPEKKIEKKRSIFLRSWYFILPTHDKLMVTSFLFFLVVGISYLPTPHSYRIIQPTRVDCGIKHLIGNASISSQQGIFFSILLQLKIQLILTQLRFRIPHMDFII